MTRIKKLLLAGSMAVVTCCVSLSSSILNVSSLFSRVKANAESNSDEKSIFNNDNEKLKDITETQNGKILSVSNLQNSAKKGESIYIPKSMIVSTVDSTTGAVTGSNLITNLTTNNARIVIKNPYGINLLDENNEPIAKKDTTTGSGSEDSGEVSSLADETGEGTVGVTPTEPTKDPSDISSKLAVELEETDDTENHPNCFKFTPSQIGTYTIQYAINDGSALGIWTTSSIYKIDVSAEQYAIEFSSNNPIVMPDNIDTSENIDAKYKTVNIALPLFYNGKGEQIKKFVLEHKEGDSNPYYLAEYKTLNNVYFDANNSPCEVDGDPNATGKNVYETYSTYVIKKVANKEAFDALNVNNEYKYSVAINTKVSAKQKGNSNASIEGSDQTLTISKFDNLFTNSSTGANLEVNYIDCAYTFEAGYGLNIVDYRLYETDKTSSTAEAPLSSVSTTINGSSNYKHTEIDVGVSVSSNIRSSATSIGKKTYLPEVSAVNKKANRNTIPAYYFYKVAYIDSSNGNKLIYDNPNYVVMGVDDGGVYFIPKVQGSFNIIYDAQDFYYKVADDKTGHSDRFAEDYDYDVNVTDRTSPDLFLVNSYDYDKLTAYLKEDLEEDEKETLKKEAEKEIAKLKESDLSYSIPTKYAIVGGTDKSKYTKITIPAIYTEDNFKDISELRVFKTISSTDGFKDGDKELSNFKINVQDGSSGNATGFSSSLTSKINIDDIISFNVENLPANYFYAQGNFYDKSTNRAATDAEITNNKLRVFGTGTETDPYHLGVWKTEKYTPEGGTETTREVEDTTAVIPAGYYFDGTQEYTDTTKPDPRIRRCETTANADTVKKLKTSSTVTLTIDPNLFKAGEYTIEFRVTDGVYANNTGDKFTFTLVDGEEANSLDKEAPEVKFTTATTLGNVGDNQKISIAKPNVTDDVDNRILTKYYIEVNGIYQEIKLDSDNKLTFNTSDKIKYTVQEGDPAVDVEKEDTIYNLAEASESKKINVYAIAYDDFATLTKNPIDDKANFKLTEEYLAENATGKDGLVHIGYDVYPISIKYVSDKIAPVVGKKNDLESDVQNILRTTFEDADYELFKNGVMETNFKQGEKVLVNGITFYDNTDNAYVKSIKVVDSQGNVVSSQSLSITDFKKYIDAQVEIDYAKTGNTKSKAEIKEEIEDTIRQQLYLTTEDIPLKIMSGETEIENPEFNNIKIPTDSSIKYTVKDFKFKHYFPGISFIASESDNYTVTYEICDASSNNVTAFSFVLKEATDTQAPIISGISNATNTIELGESYYLRDVKITDKEEVKVFWEVNGAKTGNKNNWFNKSTLVFTPQEVDVYTITCIAKDAKGNTSSKQFVVTVKDTSKPTIEISNNCPPSAYTTRNAKTITIDEGAGDGETVNGKKLDWQNSVLPTVNLPTFKATDKYETESQFESLGAVGTLTIKTPGSAEYVIDTTGKLITGGVNDINLKLETVGGISYYTFTPKERGQYTATYSAKDLNGNTAEKDEIWTVNVGDTQEPTIHLTKALRDRLSKGLSLEGDNNTFVIDTKARIYDTPENENDPNYAIADLYVQDNYKFSVREGHTDKYDPSASEEDRKKETYNFVYVSVSISNENGNTNSGYSKLESQGDGVDRFKFDTAGTYTVTFTVTDSCGKSANWSEKLVVTKESKSTLDTTKIVGIVLIVVSVLILGGVVIYFVKGTKFLPKRKKSANSKKEEPKTPETKE